MFGPNRKRAVNREKYISGPIWPNKIMGFKQACVNARDNPQVQGIIVAISKGGSDKYGVSNPHGAKGKINIL